MDIDACIDEVIAREGGYSDHAAARGGPTRWGITQATARAHGYHGDMRQLPYAVAASIYREQYWSAPHFDKVAKRAEALAFELFDTGVNMGPAIATAFLQRALNALNRGQRDFPDLRVDSRIGPQTLVALDAFLALRGEAGEAVLVKATDALQGERYVALAERRPANEAFLYGWLANRIG